MVARSGTPQEGTVQLDGRVAVITGASMGIGRAIATAFASEGASLMLCARGREGLEETQAALRPHGRRVEIMRADVGDEAEAGAVIERAERAFGGIDILVNNAGVYGPIGPVWENDPEEWWAAVRINLLGTFLMCRHAMPVLARGGGGSIVNMAGGGALSPFPRYTAYGISKAGVVRFTETLAEEAKELGIRVNAIAPGFVVTRLHQETVRAGERAGKAFLEKTREVLREGGVPAETPAALAVFLASDESSGLSGRVLSAVWDSWRDLGPRIPEIMERDVYTMRRIMPRDRGHDW